jgi:hypothetical protein
MLFAIKFSSQVGIIARKFYGSFYNLSFKWYMKTSDARFLKGKQFCIVPVIDKQEKEILTMPLRPRACDVYSVLKLH